MAEPIGSAGSGPHDVHVLHPRIAGSVPLRRLHRRSVGLVVVGALLVLAAVTLDAARARGESADRCARFSAASVARAAEVTGSGARVVVIGDSYSAGLGLAEPVRSWPARLPGRVHVAGFSGSGFSRDASPCGPVSFADRAPAALRSGAELVVVEGGLNDVDQSSAAITTGLRRVLRAARGHRVVLVGPPTAPARSRGVPRVDAILARLAAAYGVDYVRTSDLALAYLADRLHLTPAGHRAFGDAVAQRIAALG